MAGCNTPEENAADLQREDEEAHTLKTYHVTWEIELDAFSARGAAKEALACLQERGSICTVFKVTQFQDDPMDCEEETVDLSEPEEEDPS